MAEGLAWLRKAPFKGGTVEIRPFFESEDFHGIASDEIIEQEKGWRAAQAKKAPAHQG